MEIAIVEIVKTYNGVVGVRALYGLLYNAGHAANNIAKGIKSLEASGVLVHEMRDGYEVGVYILK